MRTIIAAVLFIALSSACGKKENGVTISPQEMQLFQELKAKDKAREAERREDRELLNRLKEKESAREELASDPSKFISAENTKVGMRGIINTYSRATSIEFTNRSGVDVSQLQGQITYIGKSGEELATVPFTAEGEVGAGETKTLSVTAGEISSAVSNCRVVVRKVRIIGG